MSFRHSFSLTFLALAAVAGRAQTVPPAPPADPLHLDDLVVTASPLARGADEISAPTHVLAGDALARRQQGTLGETLAGLPGVDSTYFGPGASRPVIRGLGGDRIRVLTGGVGTLDASVVSPDHAVSLDPLLIDRVEVVRGPAALLYGGGAIGGVVNVIDGRIPEALPAGPVTGRLEVRGDTAADERTTAGVLTGAAGQFAWRLDGFRRLTGDIDIPGFAETAALRAEHELEEAEHAGEEHEEEAPAFGTLPNTATETNGAAFGLSYIGGRGHLGFSYSGLDSLYGVPGHEHHEEEPAAGEAEDEDAGHDEHGGVRIDLRQRRGDVHGEWLAPVGLLRAARFQLGVADYEHTELEGDEIGTRFTNQAHEGRLELLHEKVGDFEGALGWQFARSDFAAAGAEAFMPPSVTRQQAVFLYEERGRGDWTAQFGARVEWQKITPAAVSGLPARRHTGETFTAGLIWRVSEAGSLALSASANERAPNAQELYADGPHAGTGAYELGDPTLGTEQSRGLDLSYRHRRGAVTGELSVFLNRFDGYIYEAATGAEEDGLPVYAFVQRDAELYGAEAELVFHLHETKETVADVRVMADSVRATNTSDDTPLPRTTPVRLGLGFDWQHGPWSVSADWRHVVKADRLAPGETASPAYDMVGIGTAWRFTAGRTHGELFVQGRNLLDETARVHASFLKDLAPLPGRNFTAGVRFSF
ncbi:putative TonB-dependent receptor precursor [Lacunisphaera limnophila]|uniref:Putative TonB-dependent receptor n=1 Tax=Lacunisphaera limnophila TaxID=1838286 RepID=A0A1D8ASF7_9BACT|nr:TonB-dependent receptor [Lacunisphaera limnophila]AOS43835.1 putative TonB-dependent receptor precursor [Lacunisphaera limnophila]